MVNSVLKAQPQLT